MPRSQKQAKQSSQHSTEYGKYGHGSLLLSPLQFCAHIYTHIYALDWLYDLTYHAQKQVVMEKYMATSSARRNINISIASENADFVKQIGMNLSKAVDSLIIEIRRAKARETWVIENQAALAERRRLLESEGGTAAERLYGVLPTQES